MTRTDDYLDEDFRESIEDAMAAWQRLKHDAGFDLQGVFRRRELVPFVLIPRQRSCEIIMALKGRT
jgi:hypothetical protein